MLDRLSWYKSTNPLTSSGIPTTAASVQYSWDYNNIRNEYDIWNYSIILTTKALSISAVPSLWPALLITSSTLPVIQRWPSSS